MHIRSAPQDANLVLVTVSTNARRDNPEFYRSVDAESHWDLIDSVGQGENPEDMVVAIDWDPAIWNRVYAGTDGGKIYRSGDGGQRWEALEVDLPRIAVGAMAVSIPSS